MNSDYHSELIGDKFVHHLNINFVNKETVLILGGHPHEEITFRYVLRFENVVLQDLNGIQPFNIFWGMEVSDQYADFAEQQKDYLLRMYNYFTPRFLEEIQLDTSLKYYFISSTIGLCGFIICRNAVLVKE